MKKIQKILTISLMTIGMSSLSQANTDSYGINVQYQSGFKEAGCSEIAWQQNVAHYQSKVNEYNEMSAKLNEAIMNRVVDPSKLNVGDCIGDLNTFYKGTLDSMKKIYDQAKSWNSSGFASLAQSAFDGLIGQITDQVKEQACKAIKDQINSGLKSSGLSKLSGEINQMSKNPFGYAMSKSGIGNGSINFGNSINVEFGSIVENAVKQQGGK